MTRTYRSWTLLLCAALLGTAQDKSPVDDFDEADTMLAAAAAARVSERPKGGFVPDEHTAIRIGEAVAAALYGDKRAARNRPFRARLKGDVWTVIGTVTPGADGGAAMMRIRKSDGAVLIAFHAH